MDAFYTDVRPAPRRLARVPRACPPTRWPPTRSGYQEKIDADRVGGNQAGGEPKTMTNPTVEQLIARSNRLGADPRNTNYAGGNTSAKGTETDPVTGEPSSCCGSRDPAATSAR